MDEKKIDGKNSGGVESGGERTGDAGVRQEGPQDSFGPSWSMLGLRSESRQLGWVMSFVRPGFLLIALFEIACVAVGIYANPAIALKGLPLEIFNVLAGFVCLAFTWTVLFDYHWRATVLGLGAMILVAATSVGLLTGRTEPLFMSVMLLMVGAGSLVPWDGRWQAALSALCLGWMAINPIWVPIAKDGLYPWLGLLAAVGLAHLAVSMKQRYEKDVQQEVRLMAELMGGRTNRTN